MKKILTLLFLVIFLFSCDNKETNNVTKFKTSIFTKENVIPIVRFKMYENDINLIVDTGSEMSIIDEDYYKNNKQCFHLIDSVELNINTINGVSPQKTYIVRSVLNDSLPLQLYVMNLSETIDNIYLNQQITVNGIIGVDFLYQKNVVIDFKNKIIENL